MKIYKEYSNGKWNYRLWSFDEQRYYHVSAAEAEKLVRQGEAEIVAVL